MFEVHRDTREAAAAELEDMDGVCVVQSLAVQHVDKECLSPACLSLFDKLQTGSVVQVCLQCVAQARHKSLLSPGGA